MDAFCIAHAVITGNEDKRGGTSFFKFVTDHYLDIDHSAVTNVSDRDKGLIESISSIFPNVNSFFCKRHRSGNIAGKFRGNAVRAFL